MSYLKPNEMKPDLKSQTFAYYLPKKYQMRVTGRAGYTPQVMHLTTLRGGHIL